MQSISSALASTTCCFQLSYFKFHPIAVNSSASVSAPHPSFAFSRCRGVLACKSTQRAAAAAAAVTDVGIGAAEPSSVTSVIPKKVLVPIGYGTEEMEAVIVVHVLRQAGAHVTVASVESQLEVEASSGLKLVADTLINSCTDVIYDLIALPGGMPGSVRLRDCETLRAIMSKHTEEKRLYGAICAAPAVTLLPWGLLKRKQTTCHPAFMDKLSSFWAVKSNIKVSGELTTSRGPGTAFEFALSLVGQLVGESVAQEVKSSLLLNTEDCLRKELNGVEWLFEQLPQVLIPVADGCEEIEIVTIADVLRRANVNVVIASVGKSREIEASQGTKIIADKLIDDVAADSIYDLIALPGGLKGSKQLSKSKVLKKLLKEQESGGRIYGAVSSSLALLEKQGLLKDKTIATGSPISAKSTSKVVEDAKVVIDGKLITSKGLGTTVDFTLAIVSKLFGHARARSVAEGLVYEYPRR